MTESFRLGETLEITESKCLLVTGRDMPLRHPKSKMESVHMNFFSIRSHKKKKVIPPLNFVTYGEHKLKS